MPERCERRGSSRRVPSAMREQLQKERTDA